ncbi:MAG: tetratricopeptide repeat protein [Candidatus Methanoperedens sp.]|nr:tetratricopeptide repeat protein [Candidatus Methanoperedens sp.]
MVLEISEDKAYTDAFVWVNKGNTLVESGMYQEAIQCYDKALEINPGMADVWNNKALAMARIARYEEAVTCYNKAIDLKPDDEEVIYNKGIALAHLGLTKEAIECYDKILEKKPLDAGAWCLKGDILFESGDFEGALQAYDRSIKANSRDETVWNNRGLTLVKLNRLPEALESYDKALEINPKVEKIWSNKGLAITKMGKDGEQTDLQKIASSIPGEEKLLEEMQVYTDIEHGQTEASVVGGEFKTLSEYIIENKDEKSNELENIISIKVQNPIKPLYEPIIEKLENENQTKCAEVSEPVVPVKREITDHEISAESKDYLVKGNSYFSKRKYIQAIDYFDISIRTDAQNSIAWNNKGLALARLGKIDEALTCYEKALEITPDDHVFLINKGNILYKKGNPKDSFKAFQLAYELNPQSNNAIKGLELCLQSLKKSMKKKK